jgi:hypothetical protein
MAELTHPPTPRPHHSAHALRVAGRAHELPPGITACFVVIVAAWPFLIPWRALFAP